MISVATRSPAARSGAIQAYKPVYEETHLGNETSYIDEVLKALDYSRHFQFQQPSMHRTVGEMWTLQPADFRSAIGIAGGFFIGAAPMKSWVLEVTTLIDQGKEDLALKAISFAVNRVKSKGNYTEISKELDSFPLKKLPDVILVALLRNTFTIRSHISSWARVFEIIEEILKGRTCESDRLLRGLRPKV